MDFDRRNGIKRALLGAGVGAVALAGINRAAAETIVTDEYVSVDGKRFTNAATAVVGRSGNVDYLCDGVDDGIQIQAAINAVNIAGGGTVFIRNGTYYIESLMVLKSNVDLVGESKNAVIERPTGSSAHRIFEGVSASNFSIRNLTINANEVDISAAQCVVRIGQIGQECEYFTLDGLSIIGGGKTCLSIFACSNFTLNDIVLKSGSQVDQADGCTIGRSAHFNISNMLIYSGDDGVGISSSQYGNLCNISRYGAFAGGTVKIGSYGSDLRDNHDITGTNIINVSTGATGTCLAFFPGFDDAKFTMENFAFSNIIGINGESTVSITGSDNLQTGVDMTFQNVIISNIIGNGNVDTFIINDKHAIRDLTVNGLISDSATHMGVVVESGKDIAFSNLRIKDSVSSGIWINPTLGSAYIGDISFDGVNMSGCGGSSAFYCRTGLAATSNLTITDIVVNNSPDGGGIGIESSTATINGGILHDNFRHGIRSRNSDVSGLFIRGCYVYDNDIGLDVLSPNNVRITDSTFSNALDFFGNPPLSYDTRDVPTISSGSGAPTSTPEKIGNVYIDTSAPALYYAKGSASSADWVQQ